ncbi:uncharacterized protein IUM83_19893 [Phytophthora cinnamomi]|uniref:uncharacterized protein n=1 Tax=Phytophthora cinnamomi TaxID=4785 RepID=UPI00355A048C|nr:hypothetical protein IUM83_19893 [Phytophthora cinnamomi]
MREQNRIVLATLDGLGEVSALILRIKKRKILEKLEASEVDEPGGSGGGNIVQYTYTALTAHVHVDVIDECSL